MPSPKLSNEAWKQVRIASEQGCTDEELVRVYGVSREAIRQRRWREKWNTPAIMEKEKAMAAMMAQSKTSNSATVTNVTGGSVTAAQVLAERGEMGSLRASELLLRLLNTAIPEKLSALRNASDVVTALNGVRKAAGMDREQVNVSLGLAMFGQDEGKAWREAENPPLT